MATQIAKAYVQIIPSAEGMKGALTQIMKTESTDASGTFTDSFMGGFKEGLVKGLAKIGIGAMVGKFFKDAMSEGAALEQSIGGIETLFGTGGQSIEEYASSVGKSVDEISGYYSMLESAQELALNNANEAYKTAGLSANDYMQTITGFAASLKASTKDEYEAASVADQAIIDMSDNANKMGTSMESIQNAYQGFAKQNYTMLDNLKLGYGGTKSEMERLLSDAEALSGIHYDIDSLSDVYSAIHVIQDQLGITGTTAKEASSTFEGSLNAMKSAASNVLGSMALGEDIRPALEGLLDSASTFFFDNFVPMIGTVIAALPGVIATFITEGIPKLLQNGEELLQGIADGMSADAGGSIASSVADVILSLISTLGEHLPRILVLGAEILAKLIAGLIGAIPDLVASIPDIIMGIVNAFAESKDEFIEIGINIIEGIKNGILGAVGKIKDAAKEAASKALESAKNFLGINSPSKVFREQVGENIGLGMAAGISDSENAVSKAIDELSASTVDGFNADFALSTSSYTDGAVAGGSEKTNDVINAILQIGTAIVAAVNGIEMPSVNINDRDIFEAYKRGATLSGASLIGG